MRTRLLKLLEKNARYSMEELAGLLETTPEAVAEEMDLLENSGIINGYKTIINWDKVVPEMVEAIIELKVTPQKGSGFDKIASDIAKLPEVRSVYLVSGGFDLAVIVRGMSMKEIALFVGERLSTFDTVLSTATHFLLNAYKADGRILVGDTKDERVITL